MAEPTPPGPETRSIGEIALGSLLEESSTMRPDEVCGAVCQKAEMIGLEDVSVHLVDKRQLVLVPFAEDGGATIDIDTSEAGRCFRESRTIEVEADDGSTRLWLPMLDGTSRVGVLGGTTRDEDPLLRQRAAQLAELAGELFITKSGYGDRIVNASRREELSLAAEIRWSLVPPLTFLSTDVSVVGYLEPAYDLAGDTFDYALNGNTAHVAIFDAVGHGLEASLIANVALLSYRHSRRHGLGMTDTYAAMDEAIEASFDRSAYVTAQLATLDLPDGLLRWISAGHPAPLLIRTGEPARELARDTVLPAGIAQGAPEIHEEALRPGDVVAFYSDGVSEARSADDSLFGIERLGRLVDEGRTAGVNLPEIARRVVHDVVDHQGGAVVDDTTLLLVGWRL